MWPQVGDAWWASYCDEYGVPGFAHTTVLPSPIDQLIDTARAVAVTDSPGTAAVAVCVDHVVAPTRVHIQVGNPTTWRDVTGGDNTICGPANPNNAAARAAKIAGVGCAPPNPVGGAGSQTTNCTIATAPGGRPTIP